jgi:hypothetical protein
MAAFVRRRECVPCWFSHEFDPFFHYAAIHSRQIKLLPDNRLHRIWWDNAKWKSGLNPAEAQQLAFLQQHFGKSGPYFYGIARGIDERQVRPDRIRKSVGAEDTFVDDIDDLDLAKAELRPLAEKV